MESSAEGVSVSKITTKVKQKFAARFYNKVKGAVSWLGQGGHVFNEEEKWVRFINGNPPKDKAKTQTQPVINLEDPKIKEHLLFYVTEKLGQKAKGEEVKLTKDTGLVNFLRCHDVQKEVIDQTPDDKAWIMAGKLVESICQKKKELINRKWVETEKLLKGEPANAPVKM